MKTGKVRIIGGKWKGKKILFNLDSNLRPTPDRAKEMIFNWLGQDLFDFTCLDLFSGTGAMGLESLSRGSKKVFFIDNFNPNTIEDSSNPISSRRKDIIFLFE